MADMLMPLKGLINRLSVGQKVMTVIIAEVISYTIVTTIALSQIHAVGIEVKQMSDIYLPLFSSTESIRQQIQEGRLNFKEIIFVGDRVVYDKEAEETYIAARIRYQDGSRDIEEKIIWAESLIKHSVRQHGGKDSLIKQYGDRLRGQLSNIRQANRIHNKRVEKIMRHVEDGSFLMGMEMIGEVAASEAILTDEIDRLVEGLEELKKASVAYAVKVQQTASLWTILGSILTVCIVISIFFLVVKKNISKPLHMLKDAINSFDALKEVEDGEQEKKLMARGDELGMVSRSFHALKHHLWSQGHALRAAKEEAETANRAKSRFLAAASHDLRQPLHAMQMYIAALRQKVHEQDVLAVVSNIDAVSVSTGRMLNALLDVSQLEAGTVKPQVTEFPVQEVLRRVTRAFAPLAERKGLDLRLVPSSVFVRSDSVLLERVVGNFVSNAIRYTRQGRVLIGCRRRRGEISIEVLDTGPGVPAEHAAEIFEDFHQLHNKERDRSKGLGLGLSIVRRLSDCMGHRIEHSSESGRGSRFAILVESLDELTAEPVEEYSLDSIFFGFTGHTVLLIEDDVMVLDSTQQLLESWGCDVIAAQSSKEAIQIVTNDGAVPEIIVADYRLPGGHDGVEAITRIQLLLGSAIPGIIVTGEAEHSEVKEISELGYRVLSKPVRPAKLRARIKHLLSQQSADGGRTPEIRKSA